MNYDTVNTLAATTSLSLTSITPLLQPSLFSLKFIALMNFMV